MRGSRMLSVAALLVATGAGAAASPATSTPAADGAGHPSRAASYTVLGQPDLASTSLGSRCSDPKARFNQHDFGGGFVVDGPTGIALGPRGRLFVADDGGHRVLSWPDSSGLQACQPADLVIGAANLAGPEAIAVDGNGALYVADTLDHTVKIFRPGTGGDYRLVVTLGSPGVSGTDQAHFEYPRGLAVSEDGRLFVADDYNNRVLIFDPPFTSGEGAVDSIYAGANGGLGHPKALAAVGSSLFVADYDGGRVLRFTGPFDTPDQTYAATGVFAGLTNPVDLAADADGTLFVSDQSGASTRIARFDDALSGPGAVAPVSSSSEQTSSALGLASDPRGRLFIADYSSFRVVVRSEPAAVAPVDAAATPATARLLADLRSRAGRATNRVTLGQEMATWKAHKNTGWYRDFRLLHQRELPQPKIMSSELSYLMGDAANLAAITTMKAFAAQGGIIAVDWHPDNPVRPAEYGVPLSNDELASLSGPDSQARQAWRAQLDVAAAALAKFEAAGVPVLFRPFVEMNGHRFFWWSDDGGRGQHRAVRMAAFARLWDSTRDYLTTTKGLHDLLFVYSTNQPDRGAAGPALDYYPGGDSVDVVGADVYQRSLNLNGPDRGRNTYEALVSTGKPFGLSEFGQGEPSQGGDWDARTLVKRVRDSYPATVYAIAWYSTPGSTYGLADLAHVPELLRDALVRVQPYRG